MSASKPQITKPKLVIVEGRDEELLVGAVLQVHVRREDVQVLPIGSKTLLRNNLEMLVADPRYPRVDALAVIRDADHPKDDTMAPGDAAPAAWASVRDSLRNAGIPVPEQHGAFCDGPPRVAIFIMPDGTSDGMLEDLCLRSVAADPALACVDRYFSCLSEINMAPRVVARAKARLHVFLASRPEPDRRLGEAAKAGYFPWGDAAFATLVELLRAL